MFSMLSPLRSNRGTVVHLFFCCSKENYGCEAVFVPDVDYFGDPYRTRSNPKKQEEKPLGSVYQTNTSWVFRLIYCWRLFVFIIYFKLRNWTWQLERNVIVTLCVWATRNKERPFLFYLQPAVTMADTVPIFSPVSQGMLFAILLVRTHGLAAAHCQGEQVLVYEIYQRYDDIDLIANLSLNYPNGNTGIVSTVKGLRQKMFAEDKKASAKFTSLKFSFLFHVISKNTHTDKRV